MFPSVVFLQADLYNSARSIRGPWPACFLAGRRYSFAVIDIYASNAGDKGCDFTVNKNRPVNLDIATIKLPITAYVSILHRASGIVLFAAMAILLCGLDSSLESSASFAALKEGLQNPIYQFLVWGTLAALAYHLVAGVRHLIMDMGIGETLQGGQDGAKVALVVAIVLIILAGVWVW